MGSLVMPFKWVMDQCRKLGYIPGSIGNVEIQGDFRRKLELSTKKEMELQAQPLCFFVCVRSGNMLSNKEMNLDKFENLRWIPVPESMISRLGKANPSYRAKWARWMINTLLPRLKAEGRIQEIEAEAVKF
jgi:hypothetical protein